MPIAWHHQQRTELPLKPLREFKKLIFIFGLCHEVKPTVFSTKCFFFNLTLHSKQNEAKHDLVTLSMSASIKPRMGVHCNDCFEVQRNFIWWKKRSVDFQVEE